MEDAANQLVYFSEDPSLGERCTNHASGALKPDSVRVPRKDCKLDLAALSVLDYGKGTVSLLWREPMTPPIANIEH